MDGAGGTVVRPAPIWPPAWVDFRVRRTGRPPKDVARAEPKAVTPRLAEVTARLTVVSVRSGAACSAGEPQTSQ